MIRMRKQRPHKLTQVGGSRVGPRPTRCPGVLASGVLGFPSFTTPLSWRMINGWISWFSPRICRGSRGELSVGLEELEKVMPDGELDWASFQNK